VIAPKLVAAAGIVLSGWVLATVLRHSGQEVYDLPGWAVALGAGAALVAAVGWMVVIRTSGWTGVAVAVVGAFTVASVGVMPIIGVLAFVGGMVWMAGAVQRRPDRRGLAGGLLVAVGLPVAALVATDGPIVRCRDDGVSTSSSLFRGNDSSTGSGTSSEGGVTDGSIRSGDRTYTYRCAGDRLVRFEVIPSSR
jgi:hypothetical protein